MPNFLCEKNTAEAIALSLCQVFNTLLYLGHVPMIWKRANISPVFKGDKQFPTKNYWLISLLCIVSKILERCVFNHCFPVLSPNIYNFQYGFIKGRSRVTQFLFVYYSIMDTLANDQEVDAIHIDLSKAFDRVPPSPVA